MVTILYKYDVLVPRKTYARFYESRVVLHSFVYKNFRIKTETKNPVKRNNAIFIDM